MKSGVKVIGARADITTINGTVWFITDTDAELAGVTVDDYIGVYISNSPGALVRNCRITNGSWGFLIYSAAPTLRHNEITGNSKGIYLGSNAGIQCRYPE
jgi:parallel beta-helix repeat protein